MADKRLRLVGETKLRSETRALHNRVQIEVDGDVSRAVADAFGYPLGGPLTRQPVVSGSPDVARFLRRWSDQMDATARYVEMRERPPLSDPKPPREVVNLPDHFMVSCPACNGEGYFLCELCEGDACVSKRRADAWRDS